MVSRNTTLVPSLGLRIGPACEPGLSAGMRRERVPPMEKEIKKEKTSAKAEVMRSGRRVRHSLCQMSFCVRD